MDIQIITPPIADESDPLDAGLVWLTEAISQVSADAVAHGMLGGNFGYGAHWENEVFMMHPYCWCEKPDCLWCCIWLSNEAKCSEEEAEAHRKMHTEAVRAKYGDWAAEYPGAPHFWHKKSGLQVRWYKWIGRDMITTNVPEDLIAIFAECAASFRP